MANLETKKSSRDDGLVAILALSKKYYMNQICMQPDLVQLYDPDHRVIIIEVSTTRDPTPHDKDYVISLQYMQRQCHDSINISNLTVPSIEPGASRLYSIVVEMSNIATKPSSCDDGLVSRLAISS